MENDNYICPRCQDRKIIGDYNYYKCCEICGRICCLDCIALTACQTIWGTCKDCYDYRCRICNRANLSRLVNLYLHDEVPPPECDECLSKRK